MITAWDPGKTTGFAIWSPEGELRELGQCDINDMVTTWRRLESTHGKITAVIYEDFRLFAKKARQQTGSNMPASQVIGMLRTLAELSDAHETVQPANIKDIAIKWSGVARPLDHSATHSIDAYLHGFYWMKRQGIVKTVLQKQKAAENNQGEPPP